jgi:hypothetical protein
MHPPARHTLPSPADRPAPPISRAHSLSLVPALPLTTRSRSSAPSPSPVIGQRRDRRRPPSAPSPRHYSPTSKVWRLASLRTVIEPFRHHHLHRAILSPPLCHHHHRRSEPHRCTPPPPPPPRLPIKGPLRAPHLLAPASATPFSSPGPNRARHRRLSPLW